MEMRVVYFPSTKSFFGVGDGDWECTSSLQSHANKATVPFINKNKQLINVQFFYLDYPW